MEQALDEEEEDVGPKVNYIHFNKQINEEEEENVGPKVNYIL